MLPLFFCCCGALSPVVLGSTLLLLRFDATFHYRTLFSVPSIFAKLQPSGLKFSESDVWSHPFHITVTGPTVRILPKINLKTLMENTWAFSKFEQEKWTEMGYYLPVLRPRGLIQNVVNSSGSFHMDQALIFNEWGNKEFCTVNVCQVAIHHHKSNVK